jgi:hypothetical protein
MTAVVAFHTGPDIVLMADCRISAEAHGRVVVKHDVCQKLVVVDGSCVVGWAGDLCLARHLLRSFVNRIRDTPEADRAWLRSDVEVLSFLNREVLAHETMRIRGNHKQCKKRPVELLIAWVDHARRPNADPLDVARPTNFPRLEVVSVRSPRMEIRRRTKGVHIIETGAAIDKRLVIEAFEKVASIGRYDLEDSIPRALFAAVTCRYMLYKLSDETIGGLLQLASLSPWGAQVIPYFAWEHVAPGYGTYVAMRIERGEWVQEHRPSRTKLPVISPFDYQLHHPDVKTRNSKVFAPERSLHTSSPGVILASGLRPEVTIYDPELVPEQIQQSWGTAPLTLLTWNDAAKPRRRVRP